MVGRRSSVPEERYQARQGGPYLLCGFKEIIGCVAFEIETWLQSKRMRCLRDIGQALSWRRLLSEGRPDKSVRIRRRTCSSYGVMTVSRPATLLYGCDESLNLEGKRYRCQEARNQHQSGSSVASLMSSASASQPYDLSSLSQLPISDYENRMLTSNPLVQDELRDA